MKRFLVETLRPTVHLDGHNNLYLLEFINISCFNHFKNNLGLKGLIYSTYVLLKFHFIGILYFE